MRSCHIPFRKRIKKGVREEFFDYYFDVSEHLEQFLAIEIESGKNGNNFRRAGLPNMGGIEGGTIPHEAAALPIKATPSKN